MTGDTWTHLEMTGDTWTHQDTPGDNSDFPNSSCVSSFCFIADMDIETIHSLFFVCVHEQKATAPFSPKAHHENIVGLPLEARRTGEEVVVPPQLHRNSPAETLRPS